MFNHVLIYMLMLYDAQLWSNKYIFIWKFKYKYKNYNNNYLYYLYNDNEINIYKKNYNLTMVQSGWPWLTMVELVWSYLSIGWPWLRMVEYGWLWFTFFNYDSLWLNNLLWLTIFDYGWLWLSIIDFCCR